MDLQINLHHLVLVPLDQVGYLQMRLRSLLRRLRMLNLGLLQGLWLLLLELLLQTLLHLLVDCLAALCLWLLLVL